MHFPSALLIGGKAPEREKEQGDQGGAQGQGEAPGLPAQGPLDEGAQREPGSRRARVSRPAQEPLGDAGRAGGDALQATKRRERLCHVEPKTACEHGGKVKFGSTIQAGKKKGRRKQDEGDSSHRHLNAAAGQGHFIATGLPPPGELWEINHKPRNLDSGPAIRMRMV